MLQILSTRHHRFDALRALIAGAITRASIRPTAKHAVPAPH
ncbi:hypothetical protein [Shimia sp. CNT1-13L.2]|nr:hypothetical protein [Shimia sp. CNT1-13L.2]